MGLSRWRMRAVFRGKCGHFRGHGAFGTWLAMCSDERASFAFPNHSPNPSPMKKTSNHRKTTASRKGATSPRGKAQKAKSRGRAAERNAAAPAATASVAAIITASPEPEVKKPEVRAPMSVELARMLEEETWWRVVPVRSFDPTARKSEPPKSVRRHAALRAQSSAVRRG